MKPIPRSAWNSTLSVREWGPVCPQIDNELPAETKLSEDCLCLNIFTSSFAVGDAANGKNYLRPVMVWIHGGSFRHGTAQMKAAYDGTALAALDDVIIVTINYRIGAFGFLYMPEFNITGNMGLWDQNLALKWVQKNIIHFGGDPNRVTIFGESAGSWSVSAHILSPHSEGLFVNAIMQSGVIYDLSLMSPSNLTETFMNTINCSWSSVESCLASFQFSDHPEVDSIEFFPVYGDDFLPIEPEKIISSSGIGNEINLLVGTVGSEGAFLLITKDPVTFHPINPLEMKLDRVKGILSYLFGPSSVDFFVQSYNLSAEGINSDQLRSKLSDIVGDVTLTCPTYVFARDVVKHTNLKNVYAYYQSQRPTRSLFPFIESSTWVPASHTDDLLPVFGYPFMEEGKYSHEDLILSSMMINVWTTFAKTGKPPSIGPLSWSNWTIDSNKNVNPFIMELNSKKIGQSDQSIATSCFDRYPFPVTQFYSLKMEIGKLSNLSG